MCLQLDDFQSQQQDAPEADISNQEDAAVLEEEIRELQQMVSPFLLHLQWVEAMLRTQLILQLLAHLSHWSCALSCSKRLCITYAGR